MTRPPVDRRCTQPGCAGKDTYRVIAGCYKCGTAPVLGLFTAGHEPAGAAGDCPACGGALDWARLASEGEISEV